MIESVFILASGYLGSFESGVAAQIFGPVLGVALGTHFDPCDFVAYAVGSLFVWIAERAQNRGPSKAGSG